MIKIKYLIYLGSFVCILFGGYRLININIIKPKLQKQSALYADTLATLRNELIFKESYIEEMSKTLDLSNEKVSNDSLYYNDRISGLQTVILSQKGIIKEKDKLIFDMQDGIIEKCYNWRGKLIECK